MKHEDLLRIEHFFDHDDTPSISPGVLSPTTYLVLQSTWIAPRGQHRINGIPVHQILIYLMQHWSLGLRAKM